MSDSFILEEETARTLKQLANEDNITPEEFLAKLVKSADEARHVQFQPGKGHVRVKCSSKKCLETGERKLVYGD